MAGESGDAASVGMSADERARMAEEQMTDDERFSLLVSVMGVNDVVTVRDERIPEGVPMSAGYVPGVPRLGIQPLLMSDASLGVTNPGYREGDTATALPAGIALGASFNPVLARRSGGMVGREARSRGFNVQLAGGVNLARDPRNGRNFEYLSEDPLLSAVLAAESISGIQAEGVISTIKHYSLNCNETNRHWLDAVIDPAAHRESDLLAFEIAIEQAQPGSVMTGYNKINGDYAGGNSVLLQGVLKGVWGYPGWVMSDWGGTPGWEAALKGLDQESGLQLDMMMWQKEWFTAPLQEAYADGNVPKERLSDMVRCIFALDVRDRRRQVGAGARSRHGQAPPDRFGDGPPGHRAAQERWRPAAGRRDHGADRGDRRPRPGRRSRWVRLERGAPSRRLRRGDQGGRPRHHGSRPQPLPAPLLALGGAAQAPAWGGDRVRPRDEPDRIGAHGGTL